MDDITIFIIVNSINGIIMLLMMVACRKNFLDYMELRDDLDRFKFSANTILDRLNISTLNNYDELKKETQELDEDVTELYLSVASIQSKLRSPNNINKNKKKSKSPSLPKKGN